MSSSSDVEKLPRKSLSGKNKEHPSIFIVIHVNQVEIGQIKGAATSPVKVYAERIIVQMEDQNNKKDISFRVPCRSITSLQVY